MRAEWSGHGLKQNGGDGWCEHEACMHAAVGAKQGPGGTGELNERSVLENVPPWDPGSSRPLWERGPEILLPDFHSKGRHKEAWSPCL